MGQERPHSARERSQRGQVHPRLRGPYTCSHRLPRLILLLAAAGPEGMSASELLESSGLRELYSVKADAADQALNEDLKKLCGGSLRAWGSTDRTNGNTRSHGTPDPLVERDPTTKRYRLVAPISSLRLSLAAFDALCTLAHGLHGGRILPGGQALFDALAAALPQEQGEQLGPVLRGESRPVGALTLDLGPLPGDTIDPDVFQQVLRAVHQRQRIDFAYRPLGRGAAGEATAHTDDEVLEVRVGEHVYVTVWCEQAQRELDLRLDRFVAGSMRQSPKRAHGRKARLIPVRYRLAAQIASGGVSQRLEEQRVEMQPDGSALVSGKARSLFWARRLLLSYGEGARALDPPPLVDLMRQTIERMREVYAEEQGGDVAKD